MTPPILARRPFLRLKSPRQYNAGKLDQQLIRVEQSMPSTQSIVVFGDYTVTIADRWVSVDTTGGDITVTLPLDPASVKSLDVTVANVGPGTATVAGTISGVVNPTLAQWKSITVVSDGVRYVKTGGV